MLLSDLIAASAEILKNFGDMPVVLSNPTSGEVATIQSDDIIVGVGGDGEENLFFVGAYAEETDYEKAVKSRKPRVGLKVVK